MENNFFDFIGGNSGAWKVVKMNTVIGEPLENVTHLDLLQGSLMPCDKGVWALKGFKSTIRYAEKREKDQLIAIQAGLGRPEATAAALIPIRKNAAWWSLAQDERRQIFEEQSQHTQVGLAYLPAVARQLFHCKDIGQPFDFLTWFEYAPAHADAFEALVAALRQTKEWTFVDREIDIRLIKV